MWKSSVRRIDQTVRIPCIGIAIFTEMRYGRKKDKGGIFHMRLKGKVVLITASTRGIGLACAVRCAKEGAVEYGKITFAVSALRQMLYTDIAVIDYRL